ncbi:MAG: fimbria major subunit [Bacteroides sp.]|nr:fimbria major subunit [Bacteroides sp.]
MAQGTLDPNREQWYWEDPNYSGYGARPFSQRQEQFFYFSSLTDPYPRFKKNVRQSEYCLENTMDETDQNSSNVITRVLIRCIYKPINVKTIGESFYTYDGRTYSLEEIKEYALEAERLPVSLLTGIYKTLKEASSEEGYSFLTGIPIKNNQEVKEPFIVKGITYYYQGINYYAVKVRHRGINDLTTSYGHYGVLRNTHYTVKVDQIEGPGSPGILWNDITTRAAGSENNEDNLLYNNIETSIQIQ